MEGSVVSRLNLSTAAGTMGLVFSLFCVWAFVEGAQRVIGFDPRNLLVGLFVIAIGLIGYEIVGRWLNESSVRRSVEWQPGDPVPKDADFGKVLDRLANEYDRITLTLGPMRPLWTRRPEDIALVYDRLVDAANILEDVNESALEVAERSR